MRRALIFLLALVLFAPMLRAAPNVAVIPIAAHSSLEIVVLEERGCAYCNHFRKVIDPVYRTSKHAAHIPLVYMDVNGAAAQNLDLSGPIHMVPTIVVLDGRKEIGRIPGLVGNQEFFRVINNILANN